MAEDERVHILRGIALSWVQRASILKEIIEEYSPLFFSYEEFCEDTTGGCRRLLELYPVLLKGLTPTAEVRVKDYEPQKISDQNALQISKLSMREVEEVANILTLHEELLQKFGYTSDW